MRNLVMQAIRFVGISGIGWLLDFSIYSVLTSLFGFPVFVANICSSVPAITLVFIVSTKKIFRNGTKIPLWGKYILYVVYQMILLLLVSTLAQWLSQSIIHLLGEGVCRVAPILAKVLITPCTMVCNFCVMKLMTEKM